MADAEARIAVPKHPAKFATPMACNWDSTSMGQLGIAQQGRFGDLIRAVRGRPETSSAANLAQQFALGNSREKLPRR